MSASTVFKVSGTVSVVAPVVIVGVMGSKIGYGDGSIIPIGLMVFVPFFIGICMAWFFRSRPLSSWVVLTAIVLVSVYGFMGLYSAFFRVPARGAMDLIYRPLEQTALMVVVAILLTIPVLVGKYSKP